VYSCINSVVESPHHFGVGTVACIITTASLREAIQRFPHQSRIFCAVAFLKQYWGSCMLKMNSGGASIFAKEFVFFFVENNWPYAITNN